MTLLLPDPSPSILTVGPTLQVDLGAVAANTRTCAGSTSGAIMAVVKADGFGHGAGAVAETALANGASWLGVTSIQEALSLRDAGLTAPLLSWLNPVEADFATALGAQVDLAVPSQAHLSAVAGACSAVARVHLHLDTGMSRDGAATAEWPSLCRAARALERQGVLRVVGVMGHLGCADVPEDPANATGRTVFAWGLGIARAAGLRPPLRHLAATSATLTDPASHHTMSRVGAGLVGIDPSRTTPLAAALTLTAPVVAVRRVPTGASVGYGHTWVAERPTTLALLPLGYADGLPRAASGKAEVLVRGRRRRIVGRISMDQTVVDVGDDAVLPGETAIVFGPGGGGLDGSGAPSVADWAGWADTIEHEIVTGIGDRVARVTHRTGARR